MALPSMAVDALTWPGRAAIRALGGQVTAPSDMVTAALDATGLPQPETPSEQLRSAAVRGGASALSTAGVGAIPSVVRAAPTLTNALLTGVPSQVVGGATGGATGEATRQAGFNPLVQMAAAALGGAAGAAGTAGVGRVVSPIRPTNSPARTALVETAREEGVPLSIGQETGNRFVQNMEGGFAQLPWTGGVEAEFNQEQQRAFNAAVLRRAGVDARVASPEVLREARARIGGVINEVADRNTLAVTPALQQRLAQIEDSLRFLPPEVAGPIRARIAQFHDMQIPAGSNSGQPVPMGGWVAAVPGTSYRMLDSQLGRAIRSTSDGDRRAALNELRQTLRAAMDDSISPEDAAAWQQARRQYANLMVIADATGGAGAGAAEGNISPLALRTALDRSTGKGYVWGEGDLNDMARIGQSVMRKPPDSGTAGRSRAMDIMQGALPIGGGTLGASLGGGAEGALIGGAIGLGLPRAIQATMQSRLGRGYLTNQLGTGLTTNPSAANAAALAALVAQRNRLLEP